MNTRLSKAFRAATCECEAGLPEHIWSSIELRNKRIASFKLLVLSVMSLASLVGMVPAIKALTSDFAQSGFYEYLSLIFANTGSITSHWREFMLSLAESLPLSSIILSLGLVFIFFLSIRYAMRQITKGHLSFSLKI